jgi:hypothetical protein
MIFSVLYLLLVLAQNLFCLFVHFLCLPKENEQTSKGSQSLDPAICGIALRCSQRADASESRGVYTPLRGTPPNRFPHFAVLLSCVKWHFRI